MCGSEHKDRQENDKDQNGSDTFSSYEVAGVKWFRILGLISFRLLSVDINYSIIQRSYSEDK